MGEKKTYAENWVDNNIVNDKEDLMIIGGMASRELHNKFKLDLSPAATIAIYGITFETILDYLKKQQENRHSSFQINICNVISVSYTNLADNDAEKRGNFMPFIQQISDGPIPDTGISSPNTIELCTAWNTSHISEHPEVLTEISAMTVRNLSDRLAMRTADRELIMPIFCTFHENLISYIKLKRVDLKVTSYMIDVAGIYKIKVSEADDATEIIEYPTLIYTKKTTKDDGASTD